MKLKEAQMRKMCVTVVFKNCCYLKYIKLHKVTALPTSFVWLWNRLFYFKGM
jgi:hypothetical protein